MKDLASKYIVIENIPQFNDINSNQQQRFITLIDVIYDKNIPMAVTANHGLDNLSSSQSLEKSSSQTPHSSNCPPEQSQNVLSNKQSILSTF